MQVVEALSADEWEQVTSDSFVPLTCLAFEREFRGRLEVERPDEGLMISHVTTGGLAVDRTPRQAAHASSDDIHITLTLGGPGVIRQDGHQQRVHAGSVTTYATDRPYQLDYTAPGQRQVLVQLSKRSLGLPPGMVERSLERIAVATGSASRAFFAAVEDSPAAGRAGALRDLAATMIRASVTGIRALPATHGGLLATVRTFMRETFPEPGLTVEGIASAHFVSRRSLYELFEPLGETPGEHLRRLRLTRAAELLRSSGETIAEVAARSGFEDPTTFTRAFSREFGMLPSDYRHR